MFILRYKMIIFDKNPDHFWTMMRLVHGRIELLNLSVARTQICRVNVSLFTDCHGHTRKTIRAKEPEKSPKNRTFFEFFQVQ